MGQAEHSAEEVIEAIKGTNGIKATIAQRLGVHRHTVTNYLKRWATVREAYDNECQVTDDWAESIIVRNMKLALKEQEETKKPVDSSDSKWRLERRRRDKFATRQEVTGAEGGPVQITGLKEAIKEAWNSGDDSNT